MPHDESRKTLSRSIDDFAKELRDAAQEYETLSEQRGRTIKAWTSATPGSPEWTEGLATLSRLEEIERVAYERYMCLIDELKQRLLTEDGSLPDDDRADEGE